MSKCIECGKATKGRSDKKFCCDYCRNTYHNRHNAKQEVCLKRINNILKRNRRILGEFLENGLKTVTLEQLLKSGFDFDFFTHLGSESRRDQFYFVYEFGYQAKGEKFRLIRKEP